MKEFRAPLAIGQKRRNIDRFGHIASEDRPRAFGRRVGLVGSYVVRVHFLLGIGTALVGTRSANAIYEKGDAGFGVAGLECFSRGASPLPHSFNMSATSGTPIKM